MSDPYNIGTVTVANGGTTVTGTDTLWVGKVRKNDMFFIPAQGLQARVTEDPTDNEALAITAWAGTALSGDAYEIIPASDVTTSAARLRDLLAQMSVIEANGRGLFYRFSDSVADADPGAGYLRLNNIAIGSATAAYIDNLDANGAGVAGVIDSWDDQGTPGARGQLWVRSASDPSTFHALKVTDSVIDGTGYRKLTLVYIGGSGGFAADDELMVMFSAQGADGTNAILGAWQGPWVTAFAYDVDDLVEHGGSAYICIVAHTAGTFATDLAAAKWELAVEKGDIGNAATIAVGDVTTLAPGSSAAVTNSGTSGAAVFDFDIPRGDVGPVGVTWQGAYIAATDYVLNDGVLDNGSSWRALGPTTGNTPPVLPATSNTYWALIARAGTNGTGTGTVVGPAGATDNHIALFDGTTGELIKDSGLTVSDLIPAGYDSLLVTVSLLALQVSDNTNVALFLGDAGNRVADSFDSTTYVNVAGGTNLDTSTTGVLKPTPLTGTTTASVSLSEDSVQPNITFRNVIAAAAVSASGTYARVQLTGPNSGTAKTWSNVFLGHVAASGNAWDFDGNQVRLTFSGANSVTPAVGTSVWSDWVAIAIDETKSLIIGADGTDNNSTRLGGTLGSNYFSYYAEGVAVAGTTAPAGLASAGATIVAVSAVAVKSTAVGAENLTVSSTSFTAASVPATMKALIRVKEVEAAVAGTDYTMECSRDGGTTYTAMTLTEKFSTPGGIRIVESGDASVTGQPSGTAPRWRFKTLNNKMVELHDVYFYWNW